MLQFFGGIAASVLYMHLKTVGNAISGNDGLGKNHNPGVGDVRKPAIQVGGDGTVVVSASPSLFPWLEADDERAVGRALSGKHAQAYRF